jgi:hypothetical protein
MEVEMVAPFNPFLRWSQECKPRGDGTMACCLEDLMDSLSDMRRVVASCIKRGPTGQVHVMIRRKVNWPIWQAVAGCAQITIVWGDLNES